MKDIFSEISSNVPKSLPIFIKEQYDSDCSKFLKLSEEQWENLEIYPMLTSVDKYLQYTVGENCRPTIELLDTLVPIAKKLWFISMFNVIDDLKNNLNSTNTNLTTLYDTNTNTLNEGHELFVLYKEDPDLNHLISSKVALTLKTRARSCKLLNTILDTCIRVLPCIWEVDCREKYDDLNLKLSFVRAEVLLRSFEEYFHSNSVNRMGYSYTKRRAWITAVVRLSSLVRRIWVYKKEVGDYLINYLFPNFKLGGDDEHNELVMQKETDRCEMFYKFRLLLLICPNSSLYEQLLSQNLFKWWNLVNGDVVSSWNPMFLTFFFRAAKYSWSKGECLCEHFNDKIPLFFNMLYNGFNLPNKPKLNKYKETMPGEYTCLLSKSLKLHKKMCKLLVMLMHPPNSNVFHNTVDSVDKDTHEKCSNQSSQLTLNDNKDVLSPEFYVVEPEAYHNIVEYLRCLVNVVYPYTHPSNNGKWSLNISLFIKYLITAYSRKAARERSKFTALSTLHFHCLSKHSKDAQDKTPLNYDRSDFDHVLCAMVYGLCKQGMFSKNIQICNNYEETIKKLCHICPQEYFTSIVDKLIESLNVVNEPNQLLGSLRLLTQLSQLIVKLTPSRVNDLLHMLLSFINLSEPFITTHSLILISLLISHASTISTSMTSTLNTALGTFDEVQLNQCLSCHFDKYFFRCHIAKNVDVDTIKAKLESNTHTYLDIILFLNNFCFCHVVPEDKGDKKEGSDSKSESSPKASDAKAEEAKPKEKEPETPKKDVDKEPAKPTEGTESAKTPEEIRLLKIKNRDPELVKEHREVLEKAAEIVKDNAESLMNSVNDWSVVYFDTVLELCKNSSKVNMKGASLMNTVEVSTFLLIRSSLLNLITKLTEDTLRTVINKFLRFVTEYSFKLDIVKYVISIMALISNVNAGLLLSITFNTIESNILNSFKDNSSSSKTDAKREADTKLIWYLNLLIGAIRFANVNTPKYIDRVKKIIELCLNHHSKQVFKLTAKLLYRLSHTVHTPYMIIINSNNYKNYVVVEESKIGAEKYKEIMDNLKKEFDDKILVGWHMPTLPEYRVYKDLLIEQVNHVNQLSSMFVPRSFENSSISTSGSIGVNDTPEAEKVEDELTLSNRINRIVTLCKYLIKSLSLIVVPSSKNGCGCSSSSLINDVKHHIVSLMAPNSLGSLVEPSSVDEMELRYVVEGFVINVLVRVNRYLYLNDLMVDREKMTKLINFMVAKDFYSNEVSGNNLDELFNSLKRKVHFNTSITCTLPMVKYLSFYYGVSSKSYMQELNETAFVNLIQDYFNHIVNLHKLNPPTNYFAKNHLLSKPAESAKKSKTDEYSPSEKKEADTPKSTKSEDSDSKKAVTLDTSMLDGPSEVKIMGKDLLDIMIEKMCINNYKNVSSNTQLILKNIMFLHKSTKHYIVNSLLDHLNKLVDELSSSTPEKDSGKESESFGDQVLENVITFFDMAALNYILVNLNLLEKFLSFVMKVISQSNNKDSLMSKYDLLFIQFLNLREPPSHFKVDKHHSNNKPTAEEKANHDSGSTKAVYAETDHPKVQEVVEEESESEDQVDPKLREHSAKVKGMLKRLESLVINHWRSNLYYSSLLLVYCEHVKYDDMFRNFFLQMCQNSTNHYVLSLSLQGLLILLKNLNMPTNPDFTSSRGKLLKQKLTDALVDREVFTRVFRCFINSNHENIINSTNASNTSNTTTSIGFNILMNIIKFDRSWPRNRISNNSSTISRHNFHLSYEYFKFLTTNKGLDYVDVWDLLTELSETPQSYPENHISFIEIVGGLLKHSLELDDDSNVKLWNKLHPLLKNELNNVLNERMTDYMDVIRLILQSLHSPSSYTKWVTSSAVDSEKKLNFKYVFNFVLNYEVNPTKYNFENVFLLENNKDSVTGYNSLIIKQLKLFQALLQEYKKDSFSNYKMHNSEEKVNDLVKKVLNTLLVNLFNDSQKIRDEISVILSFMVSMFTDKFVVETINENLAKKLEENMELDSKGSKGVLNLIQLMYTLHVPFLRFDQASVYLEYSLKQLCSENVNVCDMANKCVFNIVHHFGDYDKDKIFSLFKVLLKNSKSHNKIKLVSFQLLDVLYKNYCMYIKDLKVVEALIQNYINCLNDTTLREASTNNLTTIIITLNENNYNSLIQLFTDYINQYNLNKQKLPDDGSKTDGDKENLADNKDNLVLGVYGLISLISTAPYHIPGWLPNVLVELARCGGSKYPLDIRNIVQKTLQEFFKNHIDAWEQIHANKFTTEQLDLLNTYKGSPVYFN